MNGITNTIARMGSGFAGDNMKAGAHQIYGMGGSSRLFMIVHLVVAIAIIVAIIVIVKKAKKRKNIKSEVHEDKYKNSDRDYSSALSILNNRYVNGEISDEEYIRKKAILNGEEIQLQEENTVNIEKDNTNIETNDSE
ncbi:SHOCT domain-containing protein [Clostridium sp. DL1XJH146]